VKREINENCKKLDIEISKAQKQLEVLTEKIQAHEKEKASVESSFVSRRDFPKKFESSSESFKKEDPIQIINDTLKFFKLKMKRIVGTLKESFVILKKDDQIPKVDYSDLDGLISTLGKERVDAQNFEVVAEKIAIFIEKVNDGIENLLLFKKEDTQELEKKIQNLEKRLNEKQVCKGAYYLIF